MDLHFWTRGMRIGWICDPSTAWRFGVTSCMRLHIKPTRCILRRAGSTAVGWMCCFQWSPTRWKTSHSWWHFVSRATGSASLQQLSPRCSLTFFAQSRTDRCYERESALYLLYVGRQCYTFLHAGPAIQPNFYTSHRVQHFRICIRLCTNIITLDIRPPLGRHKKAD